MNTPKTDNVIAWVAPDFKRDENKSIVVYEEQLDFLAYIHFERIEEYVNLLYKADIISGPHERIMQTIIDTAKKEIEEYANIVKAHLGKVSVEYANNKVVGCVIELQQAQG
jgi:hypothetical protein